MHHQQERRLGDQRHRREIAARVIGDKLSASLGQPVVIENRTGAGGNVGFEQAARAPKDGYLLMFTPTQVASNPGLGKVNYDPVRDFTAVAPFARSASLLVITPSLPATTVKEFIALSRAKPMAYGSTGSGGIGHLTHELFNHMAGIAKSTHVPYRGSGPIVTALLAGEVPSGMVNLSSAYGQVRSGKLKALAISSAKRSTALPDYPTIAESGVPGYEVINWYGVLAPAKTPRAIVARLHAEIVNGLNAPQLKARFANDGTVFVGSTPEAFTAFVAAEAAKYAKLVKLAGAKSGWPAGVDRVVPARTA